jgi:hypothetical protein
VTGPPSALGGCSGAGVAVAGGTSAAGTTGIGSVRWRSTSATAQPAGCCHSRPAARQTPSACCQTDLPSSPGAARPGPPPPAASWPGCCRRPRDGSLPRASLPLRPGPPRPVPFPRRRGCTSGDSGPPAPFTRTSGPAPDPAWVAVSSAAPGQGPCAAWSSSASPPGQPGPATPMPPGNPRNAGVRPSAGTAPRRAHGDTVRPASPWAAPACSATGGHLTGSAGRARVRGMKTR